MDAKFCEEGQLLDLVEDENDNEGNAGDIELEAIDASSGTKGMYCCRFQRNTDSTCFDRTMIVKWADTGEVTELKSWPHETSYGKDGEKILQIM